MSDCVFCQIIAGTAPATVVTEYVNTVIIVPLNPVTDGHVIAIPRVHVTDAFDSPTVTGNTMLTAALWASSRRLPHDDRYDSVNFITSVGRPATQSVFHLHIHVVPRRTNDGLALPWHDGDHGESS